MYFNNQFIVSLLYPVLHTIFADVSRSPNSASTNCSPSSVAVAAPSSGASNSASSPFYTFGASRLSPTTVAYGRIVSKDISGRAISAVVDLLLNCRVCSLIILGFIRIRIGAYLWARWGRGMGLLCLKFDLIIYWCRYAPPESIHKQVHIFPLYSVVKSKPPFSYCYGRCDHERVKYMAANNASSLRHHFGRKPMWPSIQMGVWRAW